MEVSASCDVTLRDESQELLLTASIPRRLGIESSRANGVQMGMLKG